MEYVSFLTTPIDPVKICADNQGLTHIAFVETIDTHDNPNWHTEQALVQLSEYFAKKRQHFELTLNPTGTAFQKTVWEALNQIPYGVTISYSTLAKSIGNPKAVRAVGGANGKNPLSIVTPCHRVIGQNGTLTGYAGGLSRKAWLLNLEGAVHTSQPSLF